MLLFWNSGDDMASSEMFKLLEGMVRIQEETDVSYISLNLIRMV
jgi:hypothetical protein